MFNQQTSDATLLVDASNAFNTINRQAALHNIEYICPSIATILNNTYNAPVRMFITGGGEIKSREGTTQGDPLAMAMYALAITPLIQRLGTHHPDSGQVWYADDASATGKLSDLHQWWSSLSELGPRFGYFPNPSKTHLVVKPEVLDDAQSLFADTGI